MSTLEEQYRGALRWYPKSWRRRNEDAVLGTLLDVADDDKRATPAAGELANLRSNALLARLGPLGRIPASVRDRVVVLTFGLGAGISIVALIAMAIFRAQLPAIVGPYETFVGPFVGYSFLSYATWLVALATALIGLKWLTRALSVLAVLVAIAVRIAANGYRPDNPMTTTTIVLLSVFAIASFVGNPFRASRGRVWIAVATASAAAFIGGTLWYQRATLGGVSGRTDWFIGPFSEWMGWLFPLVVILAMILWRATKTAWAPAILLTEIPIILFALLGWQHANVLLTVATFTAAGLATVAGCYGILRGFGLRIRITRA